MKQLIYIKRNTSDVYARSYQIISDTHLQICLVSDTLHSDPNTYFDQDFTGETIPQLQSPHINNVQELDSHIIKLLATQKYAGNTNRLVLNRNLNQCRPSKIGSALIIAFSGTGSYQPRLPILMDQVCKSLGNSIKPELLKKIHYRVHTKFHKDNQDLSNKWSGLLAGPMNFLCNNPNLLPHSYDWYSFPSGRTELLDDPANPSLKEFIKLPREIKDSFNSSPAGIQNAVQCTRKFFNDENSDKDLTKLIVLSHSSGGRSAVKYLEKLKDVYNPHTGKKTIKADLVFTIDPVREAHEAIGEALSQIAANPIKKVYNFLPVVPDVKVHPVTIWSRPQKESV